jgi:hypothetical protein
MTRYYFDLREGADLIVDDEGTNLHDIEAAQGEAARTLAGLAWETMRGLGPQAQRAEMTIAVRNDTGAVMQVRLYCEIDRAQ